MRNVRIIVVLNLQQQNCRFQTVAKITIDRVGMRSAKTFTRFFLRAAQGKATSLVASALLSHLDENQKNH